MISKALSNLINGKDLTLEHTHEIMNLIMDKKITDAQVASFLTAMRLKGETIDEITACAMVLREKCEKINPSYDVLEIVGTGGDELNTFNISTISSIVVAAAGVPVAKHGNRSVSSKCGSADVLEALGVNINVSPKKSLEILDKIGICFLFAQLYHSAMKNVAPIRKELGIRTLFNTIGPLANPANAKLQLLGVYDESLVEPMANVLAKLNVKKALVVHGRDGLDEISLTDTTTVCELNNGHINSYFISPEQLGFKRCDLKDIVGGDPEQNAQIALDIFNGKKDAKRDIVILNSAFCLHLANDNITLKECVQIISDVIDSKKALNKLNEFIELSKNY